MNWSEFLPTGIQLSYLVAASLFILGLKKLGSPSTARRGNQLAAIGMLLAVVATLLDRQVLSYGTIFLGMGIGAVIGAVAAYKVEMTAMPQMVGIFNGLGGGASALIAIAEFWRVLSTGEPLSITSLIVVVLGILIGGVTLTGSFIAFGKLQGILPGSPVVFPLQQPLNALLLGGFLVGSIYFMASPTTLPIFFGLIAVSLILGVFFVIPIGGGDMPVVISLLNSYSGLAAAAAGFVVNNNM
ncbi:MAG: NAD(P)(+) transhydrogenase (Re/Si-specific) subunit beta, partial [Kamptonema sp. SIO4C4]|nr:NAD(P)(+) transhydrogenase (Re/Si-specific) subunit beta [Kamptonema sp. SIO4C4]